MTLSIIVIITVMLLAFLLSMRLDRKSTFAYGQSIRAGELGLGALQEVTGNLLREINAGSLAGNAYTVNGTRVYIPTVSAATQPARVGFAPGDYAQDANDADKLPPTLLQVSRHNSGTYYADTYDANKLPVSAASPASTAAAAANGRLVSAARWNKPLFLSGSQNAVPAVFADQPPQWVYLTRNGSRPCADDEVRAGALLADLAGSNTNAALGRYAYVIYDEGATLDINEAGCLSSATSGADFRGKPFLAYADLSKLPGLASQADIDQLINWRNKGGLAAVSGSYAALVAQSATAGFLEARAGDNPILSRQDLIGYMTKTVGNTRAMPYLGTFSRAVSAPSWHPRWNASELGGVNTPANEATYYYAVSDTNNMFAYKDNAENPAAVNRSLANVRSRGGTVTHYRDDMTSFPYTAERGDPLMVSRFSLAKLAWLASPDTGASVPSGNKKDAIQACFGLQWTTPPAGVNGGQACWKYAGADGEGSGTIKTLEQVAADGREPDFFELLKAAILHGSLGKGTGLAALNNGQRAGRFGQIYYDIKDSLQEDKKGPAGLYTHTIGGLNPDTGFPSPSRIPDVQIIQIGANIIDQYDADSYPTAIYFPYATNNNTYKHQYDYNPMYGAVGMVYGDENLPGLAQINFINVCPDGTLAPGTSTYDNTHLLGGWFQPVVWNPHQQPAAPLTLRPERFQIRAYGGAQVYWIAKGTMNGRDYTKGYSEPVDFYQTTDPDENCPNGTINFTDSGTTFSENPTPTTVENATSPHADNVAKENYPYYNSTYTIGGRMAPRTNHFVAFCAGITPASDPGAGSSYRPFFIYTDGGLKGCIVYTYPVTTGSSSVLVDANTYALGWLDDGGKFHPYSFITAVFPNAYHVLDSNYSPSRLAGSVFTEYIAGSKWASADPRTTRFSVALSILGGGVRDHLFYNTFFSNISDSMNATGRSAVQCIPADQNHFTSNQYDMSLGSPYTPEDWAVNCPTSDLTANASTLTYYRDPDGVIRPGDAVFSTTGSGGLGNMLFLSTAASPAPASDNTAARHSRRPAILNRPFRSVGELGAVFRDQPFKTLDFFTPHSADAALLDIFTLQDETKLADNGKLTAVIAGQINPANAPVPVLEALLAGAWKKDADPACTVSGAEARALAQNLAAQLRPANAGVQPLANRADLVLTLSGSINGATVSGFRAALADQRNKAAIEAPVRALGGVTNTRTWNLMIDLIVQAGRFTPSSATLDDFLVEGERRYWLHLAIDRYTGKVVARHLEVVYE